MIGLTDRERVDEALYDDYESAKAREVSSPSNISNFTCLLVLYVKSSLDLLKWVELQSFSSFDFKHVASLTAFMQVIGCYEERKKRSLSHLSVI